MQGARKPKSPWQKYEKKRFAYSTAYVLWREEVLKGGAGSSKAIALACQHAKAMRVKAEACGNV